ncbi:hypothetical protein DFH08DRAFT_190900 [Mycena albidolilacea]|uniref:F-box domain-containing protein n=1 Tax=Mycena albidolilacea TaxID=1033008 RepID=A0AAD7AT09_9AGAR|nr:hypothetical protein DFH08DRAFT_190900 [Mycena albidolilacea]
MRTGPSFHPYGALPRTSFEKYFFCLPSEHNALIDPAEAPLVLGHICRHWRTIVYSTPMLWSSIHIPSDVPPSVRPRLERAVETWLGRSASCALSISVWPPTNSPALDNHPVIFQLLPVSRRIRSLELCGKLSLIRPLLQLGPDDLPLLKRLSPRTNAEDEPGFARILNAPALEDVSLTLYKSDDPLSYPLRWSLLTGLKLDSYASDQEGLVGALELLRRCPNLLRCELRISKGDPFDPSVNTSPIVLPQMHTLVFTGFCHFQKWIPHLVVSKLRRLQIGDRRPEDTASCIGDSYMTAHIDPNHFTPSNFHELLRSFPMISHLRLSPYSVRFAHEPITLDDGFLALFYPPHNLCPTLTDMTILAPCAGFSDAAVLAFVRARMALPTPLKQFRVDFKRAPEVDIEPYLQPFIPNGLRVELRYEDQTPARRFDARNGLEQPKSLY